MRTVFAILANLLGGIASLFSGIWGIIQFLASAVMLFLYGFVAVACWQAEDAQTFFWVLLGGLFLLAFWGAVLSPFIPRYRNIKITDRGNGKYTIRED